MIRLNNSISAVRYLLHQGLAFRAHDESKESKNRGNFRELADLLAEQNENTKRIVLINAPRNNQMVAPEIQRDIAECYAEVTNYFVCHFFHLLFTSSKWRECL
jgi:cysteinyl-tRNA synthetase